MRYVEFVETNGGRELANFALDRATKIFLKVYLYARLGLEFSFSIFELRICHFLVVLFVGLSFR